THPDIPAEHAIQGFEEVRAFTSDPERSRALFEDAMKFEKDGGMSWVARGSRREGRYIFDPAPAERGVPGAGTVHHAAWASLDNEQLDWRDRVIEAGANPTPVIDRYWFKSVYFREPSGVLFEIATMVPGFAGDEDDQARDDTVGHVGGSVLPDVGEVEASAEAMVVDHDDQSGGEKVDDELYQQVPQRTEGRAGGVAEARRGRHRVRADAVQDEA